MGGVVPVKKDVNLAGPIFYHRCSAPEQRNQKMVSLYEASIIHGWQNNECGATRVLYRAVRYKQFSSKSELAYRLAFPSFRACSAAIFLFRFAIR